METVQVGIIGCGVISQSYLTGAARSKLARVKAVADLDMDAARARAEAFGTTAVSIDELLADPEIEIVLNLTPPVSHVAVSTRILEAGKHLYSEKPYAPTFAEAGQLSALAKSSGLRIACAPDTFLGAAHQGARSLIDSGKVGAVVGGSCAWMTRSSAHRHAKPLFQVFKKGAGPILDMGPYYVTQLVHLLGPVRRVAAIATNPEPVRKVTVGPLAGAVIDIEVPTTTNAALEFHNGANVSLTLSWDAHLHSRLPCELYGQAGTLQVPDPNYFGGAVRFTEANGPYQELDISDRPFGIANRPKDGKLVEADYRFIGVVDMAVSIRQGRPHRLAEAMCLHVMEVLEAMMVSSESGRHVQIGTSFERPAPVPLGADEDVLLEPAD